MAEFLNHFFQTVQENSNLRPTFDDFKRVWTAERLTHIFLIQFKEEPFRAFARELFDFIIDRLHKEFKQEYTRDRVLAFGVFALYTLSRCQPYSDHKINHPVAIFLPLWTWEMMASLPQTFQGYIETDAYEILLYLFQKDAFVFCLERPIDYRPQSSFPYPKNGLVYCNNDESQVQIAPSNLWHSVDIPPLTQLRTEYESALRAAETGFGKQVTLDARLRKELKTFERYEAKVDKTRQKRGKSYLNDIRMGYFYQEPPPLDPERFAEYKEMCNNYDRADAHLPPIDGSRISLDAILSGELHHNSSPAPRRKPRRRVVNNDRNSGDESDVTGPPRRKKRKTKRRNGADQKDEESPSMSSRSLFDGPNRIKEERSSPLLEEFGRSDVMVNGGGGAGHHDMMGNGSVSMSSLLQQENSVSGQNPGDLDGTHDGLLPPAVADGPGDFDPSFGLAPFGMFESMHMNGANNGNDAMQLGGLPNHNMGLAPSLAGFPWIGFGQSNPDHLGVGNGSTGDDGNSDSSKRKGRKRVHSEVEDFGDMDVSSSKVSSNSSMSRAESNGGGGGGGGSGDDASNHGSGLGGGGPLDLPGLGSMANPQYFLSSGDTSFNFMNGLLAQSSSDSLGSAPTAHGFGAMGMPGMDGDWNHQNGSADAKNGDPGNFTSMIGQLDQALLKSISFLGPFDGPLETLSGNDFSQMSGLDVSQPSALSGFPETGESMPSIGAPYGANLRPPDPGQKKRRRIDHLPPTSVSAE